MRNLSIINAGMVTSVGLNASASCAAIRCAIDNFQETRFMDKGGEWIIGSEVPLEQPWRGTEKLVRLVVPAIRECLVGLDEPLKRVPLFLCISEMNRPGRLQGLDETFLERIQSELGIRFHEASKVFSDGKLSGAKALDFGDKFLQEWRLNYFVIAGVDTYLTSPTLSAYEEQDRLLTSKNSDGFIPGEAGAAILLGNQGTNQSRLVCLGIGVGNEKATVNSEEPLRADGLVQAIKTALSESGLSMGQIDYRITDLNGEQYYFKEASLALTRILRERKEEFDIWHPVDCIGEVGAAIVPCILGVVLAASKKGYGPGDKVLCHFSDDNGERAAMILSYSKGGRN